MGTNRKDQTFNLNGPSQDLRVPTLALGESTDTPSYPYSLASKLTARVRLQVGLHTFTGYRSWATHIYRLQELGYTHLQATGIGYAHLQAKGVGLHTFTGYRSCATHIYRHN